MSPGAFMRFVFLHVAACLALLGSHAAHAQTPDDAAKVRAVIADWYERVGQTPAKTPSVLIAPGGFDAGPGYSVPADLHSGSAAIRGPFLNHELAARAMVFSYDIEQLIVETHLAKARVWERGYFYAWAAQKTYESAASTLFVLEKRDGKWMILAHNSSSQGIPPNKITDPMPDLRAMHYERCGDACDPAADARKAAEW
jgi:hypothetical protein